MSASNKKKLRNAQDAEKLTQRQQAEQKEAKKTKRITIAFCVVLAVMVLVAAVSIGISAVNNSALLRRHTVAASVAGHDLNSVEMNYFYIDTINNFYNSNSDYISYMITSGVALDQQNYPFGEGTWADYFLNEALATAASTYALYDAAVAADYQLSDELRSQIDSTVQTQTLYATSIYGYSNLNDYLSAMYGIGANEKSYTQYLTMTVTASGYYSDYAGSLTYTEDAIRAADDADPKAYNSYSYCYYYLPVSDFQEGGTTDADGNTTYSDEETAAAEAAAKLAAESLLSEKIVDKETFDLAVALVKSDATATECANYGYSSLLSAAKDWISDSARVAGDKDVFANTTEDSLKGYYVVLFTGMTENKGDMVNVRHILIKPDDTTDEASWGSAMDDAQDLLDQWMAGDATEDSFAQLANENSEDTGSNTNGGLYENVYEGQMVVAFNDWCFDPDRQAGDTDIVKSEFGYHIMYFVGTVGQTYRDYMIEQTLLNEDVTEWYDGVTANYAGELKNTKYILTDLTMN